MQNKKKKLFILFIVIGLLLACLFLVLFMQLEKNTKQAESSIVGTIVEIRENSILFQDEAGGEYIVYFDSDYRGQAMETLAAGTEVKIWFSGQIAESYPMQIVAYEIEKK
jgi:membrane protein implicated in regulation of membrane protease activity